MLAYFLAFLGGIALFMYGMQLMGDGLQKAAGAKLQKILEAMTGVLAMGILLGAVVTAVLQASGATTVMTVGLVNAGLLTLKQGFGIIMGANIGTTMTAQLIAFKLSDYITILIFIGFLMQLLARKSRTKYLGQVMLGFGILMLGMDMMGKAVMPLRNYPGFVHFIEVFSSNPLLGIGIGMIMTVLIQSSSATIGILIAMAGQGLIPLEGAIPVLLGDNIGTCITAVLASLRANLTAKRVAAAHVMFNVIGSIIFVVFMPFFIKFVLLVSPDGDIARQIANAHSAFNILNTLLFMPFVNPFIKLVEKIVPGKAEIISMRPVYLDKNMLNTPSIAISLAVKEVVRMGELARKDVRLGMEAIQSFDADKVKYVLEHEPVVDALERDITDYLTQMSSSEMSESLTTRHTGLLHACTDIERIGDHGETLAKRARKLVEEDVVFSDEAKRGYFEAENVFISYLGDDLMESSVKIAQLWKEEFVISEDQKTNDLVFIQFDKEGQEYFAFLRIALKDSLIHSLGDSQHPIQLSQNNLPSAAQTPDEALVINRSSKQYYLIEKRIKHNGSFANYFSENLLQVQPEQSVKKSIKMVEDTAQKIAENFNQDDFNFQGKMKSAIFNNLEEDQELSPEKLADQLFDNNLTARLTFVDELKEAIPEPISVSDIDHSRQIKKLENQKLSLSNGIELIVPNNVYQDADSVEFIQNPDGTYSILIKNIEDIINK